MVTSVVMAFIVFGKALVNTDAIVMVRQAIGENGPTKGSSIILTNGFDIYDEREVVDIQNAIQSGPSYKST